MDEILLAPNGKKEVQEIQKEMKDRGNGPTYE